MGFLSFGRKKKADAALPTLPPKVLTRPSGLANNASATSTLSATSSGSSSGGPQQHQRAYTLPNNREPQRRSLSWATDAPRSSSVPTNAPPVPPIPTSATAASSSNSLNVPSIPYVNRELAKKGSTNTLNSTKSSRRGPHDPPPLADCLAKPRSASYHAPQVRNIWVTSASTDGHTMMAANSAVNLRNSKYHSTGSPLMPRGSFIGDPQFPQQSVSDGEFKEYTRNYEAAISKAHGLAREYHHLPPAKRDRQRFEYVGKSFAAAARLSREHWSYRCQLEKERLEGLLAIGNRMSQADALAQDLSPHRVAGTRATEGWQYASMLADAWGAKEEMSTPLEDMLTLKPNYPAFTPYGSSYSDYGHSGGYLHPGYTPGVYASYSTQAPEPIPEPEVQSSRSRARMDSTASKLSEAHSTSTHTHSGFSHSLNHSQSHNALSSTSTTGYTPSRLNRSNPKIDLSSSPELIPSVPPIPTSAPAGRSSFSIVQEPTTVRAPIKLTKGRKYRERSSVTSATVVAVS